MCQGHLTFLNDSGGGDTVILTLQRRETEFSERSSILSKVGQQMVIQYRDTASI